jgi:hypothetical protein
VQGALRAAPGEQSARAGVRPGERPLLLVDIDGVLSLFGFSSSSIPEGRFHSIDGIPHFLSTTASQHLLSLVSLFDLVWASGWEEKADEYLPHLLGLPRGLPFLSFSRTLDGVGGVGATGAGDPAASDPEAGDPGAVQTGARITRAHWKLDAIDAYAGPDRPLAWIDDAFNDACLEWAKTRGARTLLVQTAPATGLTEREAARLREWSAACPSSGASSPVPYSSAGGSPSAISSSASSSTNPGSESPAPIFSREARSASNS